MTSLVDRLSHLSGFWAFFNILFACAGAAVLLYPAALLPSSGGNKAYSNRYLRRGQLSPSSAGGLGLSRRRDVPRWDEKPGLSVWIRSFYLLIFLMLWNTYLVFAGASPGQVVTLAGTFKLPWHWAYRGTLFHPGTPQFAFRVLQRDAHLHCAGLDHHGALQAPSCASTAYGHHDPADLPERGTAKCEFARKHAKKWYTDSIKRKTRRFAIFCYPPLPRITSARRWWRAISRPFGLLGRLCGPSRMMEAVVDRDRPGSAPDIKGAR